MLMRDSRREGGAKAVCVGGGGGGRGEGRKGGRCGGGGGGGVSLCTLDVQTPLQHAHCTSLGSVLKPLSI